MKFLITGTNGFVGQVLCAELRQRGRKVVAVIRLPRALPDQGRNISIGE